MNVDMEEGSTAATSSIPALETSIAGSWWVCVVPRSKWLAKLSDPWVRLVDPLIGEAVGMRVDVDLEDGTTAAGVFVHKKLSDSVGYSLAAS